MVKEKKVYNGKLLKLYETTKRMPNGQEAYFEKIKHPGAAIVVPFFKRKIVFVRQYRAVIGKYIWELPAGTLEAAETPYRCAKREVTEETGYLVKEIKRLGAIYTTPGFCDEKIVIFKAECYALEDVDRDDDEVMDVHLFSPREVKTMFESGKINDAKTISALSMAGVI